MIETDSEGFQSPKHQYNRKKESIILTKCKIIDQANTILKQAKHSLQPDMIMGWKPKLPSCPLPLTYFNAYNQKLIQHIPNDDRFRIVYLGKRHPNSVQVNQQYSYFWKYRQRYSINVPSLQEAVKNVGKDENKFQQNIKSQITSKDLQFDSSFQSGNLQLAVRVKPNEYDLFLRSDTNTKGHTNWYYFRVNNKDFLGIVQFNICNMGKTKTLYNKGMKPYVLQSIEQNSPKSNQDGKWSQQKTFDVCFVQRYCRYGFDKKTFQLQFKYNFKKPSTTVYFAYGIPYTYTKLERFIEEITENNKDVVKCQKLCQSLGGLNLPLLTISNPKNTKFQRENDPLSGNMLKSLSLEKNKVDQEKIQKKAILITGRIHPGESNSSYVLEGFIRQLLKNNQTSIKLRQIYDFYIVPMLNPDGVVVGNFRTSYSGKDLNRQFNNLNKFIYRQIYGLDQLTRHLKQKYKKRLQFYFDFHGHSSKKNLFCYGPQYQPSNILFFKSRTFAKIIEEINPIFSYYKSIFQISPHKKTTGRAHMLWHFKIPMTYTFEISNGLYDSKQKKNIQLNEQSILDSGRAIYKGLCRYVTLETKNFGIPLTKAKVDTGIRNRQITSQKGSRQKGFKIHRILSTKGSTQQSRETSLQKKLEQFSQSQEVNDFERYINEIKQQKSFDNEPEGGSDSEGSEDDLQMQELSKLLQFVQSAADEIKQNDEPTTMNLKPKTLQKIRHRKVSFQEIDDSNKENMQLQNIPRKISKQSIEMNGSRRLMSQKMRPLKKPPLPVININTKYVLCQKKFTMEF